MKREVDINIMFAAQIEALNSQMESLSIAVNEIAEFTKKLKEDCDSIRTPKHSIPMAVADRLKP